MRLAQHLDLTHALVATLEKRGHHCSGTVLLEKVLARSLLEARSRWPGVAVDPDHFMAYVGHRIQGNDPLEALQDLQVTDLYLACACAMGHDRALRTFEAELMPEIDKTLGCQFHLDPDQLTELKQQVRFKLFIGDARAPSILQYNGRGKLISWLRIVAIRQAIDSIRRPDTKGVVLEEYPAEDLDPEMKLLKIAYQGAFKTAFETALQSISHRDRTLLALFLADKLDTQQIATIYMVHRTTVMRWIAAVQNRLYERTLAAIADHLHIDLTVARSVVRLIQSSLGVLSGCLPDDLRTRQPRRKRGKRGVTASSIGTTA